MHGVIEQTWDQFTSGQAPQVDEDFHTTLPAYEVMRRARSQLGRRYELLTFNRYRRRVQPVNATLLV